MIPSTSSKLLVNSDWTKIYQSFRNAEFQSYDFDTLRRTMISYLQETYPEEFNDYIDSSEYIALIDLIAFLGQNLAFRVDLNARENFMATAQRRDSILRLAQLISYNPSRNTPANGLLKVTSIKTTDNVYDANGTNLANQSVAWNDSSNSNWYQQFISIANSAMPGAMVFGTPNDSGVINSINTYQYVINSSNTDIPTYSFTKSINGTSMSFEVSGATFSGQDYIYEVSPRPAGNFYFLYQNDNQGSGSANTGFFTYFRQGAMASSGFNITNPVANEIVGINANNINNDDVWLWQLTSSGVYETLWTKVEALVGNNVIYNNVDNGITTLYSVTTRNGDQIDLNFADGSFGQLPQGNFRLFYRQSNGLTYTITPDQMSGINITIPYVNKNGVSNQLTLTLSLQYTVTNASGSESNQSIKTNAPQAYYIQNRMITGEDYNIAPLTAGNNILKIKSVNRISGGISKYFELSDVTGKYSSTDIYCHDGILYKEYSTPTVQFSFTTRNQIYAFLKNTVEPLLSANNYINFYFDQYPRPSLSALDYIWVVGTSSSSETTGYFVNSNYSPVQVGSYTSNNASYITVGSLVQFLPPTGYYFGPNNALLAIPSSGTIPYGGQSYIWSTIISITGDGSNSGVGLLSSGVGPIATSGYIPNGCTANEVIPTLLTTWTYAFETQIVNLCTAYQNFGISFDKTSRTWNIIVSSNLNLTGDFSLTYQGDTTNTHLDSSWLIAFSYSNSQYTVQYRMMNYLFESDEQTSFFSDTTDYNYDYVTGTVIRDQINVLAVNSNVSGSGPLNTTYQWQIDSAVIEPDGYVEPKKVIIGFYDVAGDGQIADPDAFSNIVPAVTTSTGYVYFEISSDGTSYSLYDDQSSILAYPDDSYIDLTSVNVGSIFYFYTADVFKQVVSTTSAYGESILSLSLITNFFARLGRCDIKFHYLHNTGEERRIDPAKTNIIDIYVLTSNYDTSFRNYLLSGTGTAPLAPTSQSLENDYSSVLDPIKSISDTIVYQPANYKILFGSLAETNLQATFKAVQSSSSTLSANDLTSQILNAINDFFSIDYWDFGQSFNFSELATYVMNLLTPDITNFIIVPVNTSLPFGSMYEISCQYNEILISGATASNISIIDSITAASINSTNPIITTADTTA